METKTYTKEFMEITGTYEEKDEMFKLIPLETYRIITSGPIISKGLKILSPHKFIIVAEKVK